jgi:hypothetical protein
LDAQLLKCSAVLVLSSELIAAIHFEVIHLYLPLY